MISFEEAQSIVLETAKRLPVEMLPLGRLLNRVLAETIHAPFPLPRFDNSSVDGYAVHAEDYENTSTESPLPLIVVETIHAGERGSQSLPTGKAARIMTGAPIPPGADAVVMREEVETEAGLYIRRPVRSGENIRFKGEELPEGTPVLRAGTFVTPPVIGMLATLGLPTATVYESPRVTVIVTGDELKMAGAALSDGQIYDSCGPALVAALSSIGLSKTRLHYAPDKKEILTRAVKSGLRASDIIVSVGGVSVGDRDYIRSVSAELGVRELFWRVASKPGKPLFFGIAESDGGRQILFFGLPGNPVAALVTFKLFVEPAIRRMMGHSTPSPVRLNAILDTALKKLPGRLEFVRGWLSEQDGTRHVAPVKGQESHMLSGLAAANCLILFPKEAMVIEAGSVVEVIPLHWGTV